MEHVAIDLGGRESQICVRGRDGTIIEEKRCPTASLPLYLARRPASRVIVETCTEAFGVADEARKLGHDVRVVAATLVRSLNVGARGLKTDARDARALSEASCRLELPSVHIPSTRSRQWKSMCGARDQLVRSRTRLVNTLKAWLRSQGLRIKAGTHTIRARVAALGVELPAYVHRLVDTIEFVTSQLEECDKELASITKADAVCTRLMSVPGVGPLTAVRFVAAIDDVGRFPDAHRVASYFGLVPRESSSSERRHRGGINKAGPEDVRWVVVQAAWALRRSKRAAAAPLQRWAENVQQRRGQHVAVTALARKLIGILFAMWRDGSSFDSTKGTTM